MQVISPFFEYQNYNETGEIKNIAKLYLKFFSALSLKSKVEDLKKVYSNYESMRVIIIPHHFAHSHKLNIASDYPYFCEMVS